VWISHKLEGLNRGLIEVTDLQFYSGTGGKTRFCSSLTMQATENHDDMGQIPRI
jgi:hypothetical protein